MELWQAILANAAKDCEGEITDQGTILVKKQEYIKSRCEQSQRLSFCKLFSQIFSQYFERADFEIDFSFSQPKA